ncbi:HTH luxR-type domain-containing protein [Frankia sp. Hr75.2]|nr:HTH luxR-type domain-containing protein [Frankia sp. Hr75.2]
MTGVGGVGKTRLALRTAAEARRAYPGGAWFIELAQLRDPRLLGHTVAATLGCPPRGADQLLATLTDHIASRRILLLLDNCEHLVDACAELTDILLGACPNLHVLATSRESLRVAGETVYMVSPFPVPDGHDARRHAASDATTLFRERARSVRPDFELTEDNRAVVGEICRRLDGIPLAIELAAVKTRALPPAEILARLSENTEILRHDGRRVADRQRTLRTCVDWSFDLCTPQERLLWTHLSVFAGGFELDAAEGICGDERFADPLLDLIFSLVDKSILTYEPGAERGRFLLLEMLRQYGQEKLEESGGWQAMRRRHRDWYADLAARADQEWTGPGQQSWLSLEQALAQFRRDGDLNRERETLALLTLAAALSATPEATQRYHAEWVAIAELRNDHRLRSYAEWAYAIATWRTGDPERALAVARAALTSRPDHLGFALCLETLAWIETSLGECATAAVLLGAADRLWERMGTSTVALPALFRFRRRCEARSRKALGRRSFDAAWTQGAALSSEDACARATKGSYSASPAGAAKRDPGCRLTKRERQVADLVARGLSNKEIAATLVISPRTAETHVQQILNKLGFTSRSRIAAWIADQPAGATG